VREVVLFIIAVINFLILAVALSGIGGVSDAQAAVIAALICAGLVALALTPAGEAYFRAANRLRRPRPEEDAAIRPLLENACRRCGAEVPELFVSDSECPNAFAVGRKTVAVTRGLLAQALQEEVEAVLAHELGHLAHGDSRYLQAAWVLNLVGSITAWTATAAVTVAAAFAGAAGGREGRAATAFAALVMVWLLRAVSWSLFQVQRLSLLAVCRSREYEADAFAARAGYRDGLVGFLRRLTPPQAPQGLAATLLATHPAPAKRIKRLVEAKGVTLIE